ncbi:hypothetical protein CUZ56_01756 [Saezia sanguinis]|uniref:Uncharacterized protein n=1 Tax=Saezia sanguinis TaxID=1965230 RepID=A0A433SCR8_9BURK|nr:hypothetical protein CUZ56_01756 [Saezia sanguinis]
MFKVPTHKNDVSCLLFPLNKDLFSQYKFGSRYCFKDLRFDFVNIVSILERQPFCICMDPSKNTHRKLRKRCLAFRMNQLQALSGVPNTGAKSVFTKLTHNVLR